MYYYSCAIHDNGALQRVRKGQRKSTKPLVLFVWVFFSFLADILAKASPPRLLPLEKPLLIRRDRGQAVLGDVIRIAPGALFVRQPGGFLQVWH